MNPNRGVLQEIGLRLRNPKLGLLAANTLYYKAKKKLGFVDGVDIVEEDWDNLIILDACRYDAFSQVIGDFPEITGELESRRSKAAYTRQFLRRSFHGRDLNDTVYVTASPQLYDARNSDEDPIQADFHAVIHSFLDEYLDVTSEDVQSGYRPKQTTEIAREVNGDFPNKRLIVHYLPPHWPFLGEKGRALFEGIDDAPWEELRAGELHVPREELWEAYLENVRIGLQNVAELLPELEGKTVITADHGQLLGDVVKPFPVPGYGHPGVYTDALVKVPWFVCNHSTRKRIVAESPVDVPYRPVNHDAAEQRVKERLQNLGYTPE